LREENSYWCKECFKTTV